LQNLKYAKITVFLKKHPCFWAKNGETCIFGLKTPTKKRAYEPKSVQILPKNTYMSTDFARFGGSKTPSFGFITELRGNMFRPFRAKVRFLHPLVRVNSQAATRRNIEMIFLGTTLLRDDLYLLSVSFLLLLLLRGLF
jgi:hypothetical protein